MLTCPYEEVFTAVSVVLDEWYQQEGWRPVRERPGVKPRFTDSGVLTVELVRELEGQHSERRWYRAVAANWRGLFPALPGRGVPGTRRAGAAHQEPLPAAGAVPLLAA